MYNYQSDVFLKCFYCPVCSLGWPWSQHGVSVGTKVYMCVKVWKWSVLCIFIAVSMCVWETACLGKDLQTMIKWSFFRHIKCGNMIIWVCVCICLFAAQTFSNCKIENPSFLSIHRVWTKAITSHCFCGNLSTQSQKPSRISGEIRFQVKEVVIVYYFCVILKAILFDFQYVRIPKAILDVFLTHERDG